MIRLLFSAVFFSGSVFASALPSYVVTAATGATFNASGIIPQAVPVSFAPTAANDAVAASRSIPFSVTTPQGAVSGTVKTAGVFSKGVAASLGKSLMRLNLPVVIGLALYDAYQAANMVVQPDGSFTTVTPGSALYWDITNTQKLSLRAAADSLNGTTTPWSFVSCTDTSCKYTYGGVNGTDYCCQTRIPNPAGTSAATTAPATLADKDVAIDSFSNAAASNAVRLAWEAYNAKIPLPSISVVGLQSPPVSVLSPWAETASSTDALGNVTKTLTQTEVVVSPDPAVTLDSPIPVKIVEHTQTQVNTAPTASSSKVVSSAAPGVSADPALASSAAIPPPPVQTDCEKNPDSIGCSKFGESDIPDFQLPGKDVPLTFAPTSLGGAGACPAPKTFTYFGKVYSLPYTPLCTMVTKMRPLVILLFSLAGAYIFVGGLRNG